MEQQDEQLVREPERFAMTGLSKSTWWRLEQEGLAPKRIAITERLVGWRRSELREWVARAVAEATQRKRRELVRGKRGRFVKKGKARALRLRRPRTEAAVYER
jgi:prophage regulatory protein